MKFNVDKEICSLCSVLLLLPREFWPNACLARIKVTDVRPLPAALPPNKFRKDRQVVGQVSEIDTPQEDKSRNSNLRMCTR